ncbi:MAG: TlpA family protein disulfide reductase [Actinomycetota bacterium]
MRKRLLIMLSMLIALLLLSFSFVESPSEGEVGAELSYIEGNGAVTKVPIGSRKATPDLSGTLIDGSEYRMERGKPIVLNVWASWCSPCRAEAPTLQALSEKYPDVQFLGVLTRDNLTAARAFIDRFELTFPSLRSDDVLLEFNDAMIANAIPTTLLIDKNGLIAARIGGEVTFTGLSGLIDEVLGE